MPRTRIDIAIVGAGPVGLALALQAALQLPHACITLFDARPLDRDVSADARTLALSLGSVQDLQRLQAWPAGLAQPIREVHVSQAPPSLPAATVRLRAEALKVPMLGAVLPYGALVMALQQAWHTAVDAAPTRLASRFGMPVAGLKPLAQGIEVDAGVVEAFDLVVLAEGGVFGEQRRKPLVHDYAQTAWVGTVTLAGGKPGVAFERFTRQGPAALLPLPPSGAELQAALVWCVGREDDPVAGLDDRQRRAVLDTLFPAEAGRVVGISPLKSFPLGLNAERTLVDAQGAGRIVRIGNAAQTLHPVAGQGLNLGLRDAHALIAALRRHEDVDTALRRVEWSRAPDRWMTIASTDFLARSFTWRAPFLGTARGLGLAALEAAPLLKGWLARRMMFGTR